MYIQIDRKTPAPARIALFGLGFRPFFVGAAVFAIVSVAAWALLYFARISLPLGNLSSPQWHSHEMIYGYGLAVIAGFLLTAIMNWTGVQTIHGKKLAALFALWLVARVLFLFGARYLEAAALADMLFVALLFASVATPIIRVRQWRQLGILSKVALLALGNLCFYLGAFGVVEDGAYIGLYGGLYAIVALILVIGGRVFPAFVRNGVAYEAILQNPRWIIVANILLFVLFFANQLFVRNQTALGYLSAMLFLVNAVRLVLWHTPGIWKNPLLWSLYLSFVFIDAGFLLYALSAFSDVSPFLAVHAFAFGGIGIATVGMMSRVSLGHTGRNVRTPPALTALSLSFMVLGGVIRVAFPLIDPSRYDYWIIASQLAWIAAFALFLVSYSRMLVMSRIDGQPG